MQTLPPSLALPITATYPRTKALDTFTAHIRVRSKIKAGKVLARLQSATTYSQVQAVLGKEVVAIADVLQGQTRCASWDIPDLTLAMLDSPSYLNALAGSVRAVLEAIQDGKLSKGNVLMRNAGEVGGWLGKGDWSQTTPVVSEEAALAEEFDFISFEDEVEDEVSPTQTPPQPPTRILLSPLAPVKEVFQIAKFWQKPEGGLDTNLLPQLCLEHDLMLSFALPLLAQMYANWIAAKPTST